MHENEYVRRDRELASYDPQKTFTYAILLCKKKASEEMSFHAFIDRQKTAHFIVHIDD